jgi:hypothetical protein
VRDQESTYLDSNLALDAAEEEASLKDLQSHSITYRIALGPHKGRKAFMLQSLPPLTGDRAGELVAQAAGFSLHAGVTAAVHQRNKLERLCRYITRPPVAVERLSLTPQGNVRYALKTPYRLILCLSLSASRGWVSQGPGTPTRGPLPPTSPKTRANSGLERCSTPRRTAGPATFRPSGSLIGQGKLRVIPFLLTEKCFVLPIRLP